ncbi:MAG: GAF domain-containing protein [Gammaproteobacteria bacterium]|nr:GAF domain-containing protein [Gammaproteobacteria bacterium]
MGPHFSFRENSGALEYLPKFNIRALLDAPIQFGNEFAGIVCHEHTGARHHWTLDEENFAGSIADLAALAFEVKKRQDAETALRANNLELEAKVQDRTAELAGLNADLKKKLPKGNAPKPFCWKANYACDWPLMPLTSVYGTGIINTIPLITRPNGNGN